MFAHRRIARTAAVFAAALVTFPAAALAGGNERIIGGSTAEAANWPSMARLQIAYTENGQSKTSYCGATVVAPHWVLTAAHCTFGDVIALTAGQITVVTGRPDITTNTGEAIPVSEIRRHPGYTQSGFRNDVALLRLATATSTPAMEMAVQANVGSYTSPPDRPNTAGWGWTVPGNKTTGSSVLRQAYVPLRDNNVCAAELNHVAPFDPSTMVCAGAGQTNGTTTCHGDSGGPLVVFNGARRVLWGLVSWGEPNCTEGITAFARVAAFTSFLKPAFDEVAPPPVVNPTPPPPPPPPPAVQPQPQPQPQTQTQTVDDVAPRLDRFVIPAAIRIRGGRPTSAIRIKLRCTERATIRVYLLRRSGSRFVQLPRFYRVTVNRGTSQMTLPHSIWRMKTGAYRLRFRVSDASGNTRSYHATIRARRG